MNPAEENEVRRILERKLCTPEQVDQAREIREKMAAMGLRPRSVGEVLCERGHVEAEDLEAIQREVRSSEDQESTVSGYKILEEIGRGTMGAIYKARQLSLDRDVALRVLDPELAKDASYAAQFLEEARSVARLSHTNLISGIDVGEENGLTFLVLEYADGVTLARLLRRGDALDEERALQVAIQIARALDYAHKSGVIHGDVRPQNVMITTDGVAKLCDLGVARRPLVAGEEEGDELRRAPYYVSPEQARGMTDVSPSVDQYGLGACLFHMLTSRVPFAADSREAVLAKHLTEPAPSVRRLAPGTSEPTDAVVQRCLQKSPPERFPDVAHLLQALEQALASVQAARGQAVAMTSSAAGQAAKPAKAAKGSRPKAGPGEVPVTRRRRRRR